MTEPIFHPNHLPKVTWHLGMKRFRLVLMCAEREPLDCHRSIVVARHLVLRGVDVCHIHPDGTIERHEDALRRLMTQLSLAEDMFHTFDDLVGEAYRRQRSVSHSRLRRRNQMKRPTEALPRHEDCYDRIYAEIG